MLEGWGSVAIIAGIMLAVSAGAGLLVGKLFGPWIGTTAGIAVFVGIIVYLADLIRRISTH